MLCCERYYVVKEIHSTYGGATFFLILQYLIKTFLERI